MAEQMAFRRYGEYDYEIALQAAMELGWAEPAQYADAFCLTQQGKQLRVQAEQLTNEYFYAAGSAFTPRELDELYTLLTRPPDRLGAYRPTR